MGVLARKRGKSGKAGIFITVELQLRGRGKVGSFLL
jgi:hypothetical protein